MADTELRECDIIMKGGVTSGIVFPKAIFGLSKLYRFRSIGGTSAGAIAAAFTAAAEYDRSGSGFATIASIPGVMRDNIATLFQPSPEAAVLFDIATLGFLEKRWGRVAGSIFATHGQLFVAGLATGGLLAAIAVAAGAGALSAILLLLIGGALGLGLVAVGLLKTITVDLPDLDFGLCPGPTQGDRLDAGLSNWLADTIEIVAGRMVPGGRRPSEPLTFGDLSSKAIDLRMMTTNLTLRRPNVLPNLDGNHSFCEKEFRRVFPDWIVDYLVRVSKPGIENRLMLPPAEKLPVAVATRMSLSFPFLLATVPLYRREFAKPGQPLVRMLFSDGGLSSNFPVHFFDALLPRRPTFGISLESLDENDMDRRVRLPMAAGSGMWLDARGKPKSVVSFIVSLVDAAKDWQDRLQSTLPGYRERVVTIYLDEAEGGLNLAMPAETVDTLASLGERAAGLLTGDAVDPNDEQLFDFDDHRWRRFLVAFARVEETLQQTARVWGSGQDPASFAAFVQSQIAAPKSYAGSSLKWRNDVYQRFDGIMALAGAWGPTGLRNQGDIPKPETDIRITPKA